MAATHLLAGLHGADPWLPVLRQLLRAQPEPATHEEAVMALAGLRDAHGRPKVDVAAVLDACEALLAAPEGTWHEADWRRTHPHFPRKYALVINIFTRQVPNVYTHLGAALHDADRASGPGGVSGDVRACLPLAKLMDVALEEASKPQYWGFFVGQVFRGVRYAFPKPTLAQHDPESYFRVGRELHWFEFNSASTDFEVMYRPWFCGRSGPRTVFTIQSCEGVSIKKFSAIPEEEEVLFRPLARFRVTSRTKMLTEGDLRDDVHPNNGFPDSVHLQQLPTFDPMAVLRARAAQFRQQAQEAEAAVGLNELLRGIPPTEGIPPSIQAGAVSASTLGCTMTWTSAKEYCESLGRRLCRASEILDASGKFIFGPMAGDHWTPVLDAENEWVQIGEWEKSGHGRHGMAHNSLTNGTKGACGYAAPPWGLSDDPAQEFAHVKHTVYHVP